MELLSQDFKLSFGKKELFTFKSLPAQEWSFAGFIEGASEKMATLDLYTCREYYSGLMKKGEDWHHSKALREKLTGSLGQKGSLDLEIELSLTNPDVQKVLSENDEKNFKKLYNPRNIETT